MAAGDFNWVELMTTDVAGARAFYAEVVGWDAEAAGPMHPDYTLFRAGTVEVAGMFPLPQPLRDMGVPPHWGGYVAVDDVDAMVGRVEAAGGSLRRAAEDIPEVGRFAVVADPQGAVFTLFKPNSEMAAPPAGPTPGRVGWYELMAGDLEPAFAFYAGLFGWRKTQAIDMGPMGTYQTFATPGMGADGMSGGMMTKPSAMPSPAWAFYFNVEGIEAAVARVVGAGGQVLNGPMQVPGGSWIVQGRDPQGAFFALVGPGG